MHLTVRGANGHWGSRFHRSVVFLFVGRGFRTQVLPHRHGNQGSPTEDARARPQIALYQFFNEKNASMGYEGIETRGSLG